jgi:DNA-binding GntR family transcriptional regulator
MRRDRRPDLSDRAAIAPARLVRTARLRLAVNRGGDFVQVQLAPVVRANLSAQVYASLRAALQEGRLWPGQRLKIRDLAASLRVSETPVREAVMQLVRERALVLSTSRSITVVRLSLVQYRELRRIRLELEGMAAAEATAHVTRATLVDLRAIHRQLLAAEKNGAWADAVRLNWHFHALIYRSAEMPELLNLIEGLWLRTGPLLNYQYPHAPPTYPGRHRHLDVMELLRAGDAKGVRAAIQADTREGGARLLELLEKIDAGQVNEQEFRATIPALQGKQPLPLAPLTP